MTTIPIEVIIQDAESPVTPTPEGGEETNIVVPDTGAGTINNTSNSGGIGSSASIILPAIIAVLAIGAIVAMLVHKHRKHTNSAMSKKEKLATAASGTIAILVAAVLVGNLVIPATSAATDDTNTNREGELVVDNKITITVTREADSDESIVSSVDTKSYATVYKTFGYEVAMAMAGNTTNLYLDGNESSDYYFSPVEDGTLADNTWGYTIDGEEYTAMPLIDDLAVVAKGTAPVSNEEVDINYGVKVSSDMPNGTYTGEIEYILADTGFPAALRTMQDMTTAICSSVPTPNPFKADNTTIEDNVPTIMLPDSRDNKLYRVAKLADGKCWMTQNLDLEKEDLLAGVALNDSNTDHPAASFTLPTSQIDGNESWGDDETAINTAHIYDLDDNGETYQECLLSQYGRCTEYGDAMPSDTLGNYYNWYTATAGTGTYSLGQGEVATGSVCPKGWRLPNNSTSQEPTDFSSLFALYDILESSTSKVYDSEKLTDSFKAPFFLVKAGRYNNGPTGVGSSGYIISSMANGNATRISFSYNVGYYDSSFWPWDYQGHKYSGDSVRCLAR